MVDGGLPVGPDGVVHAHVCFLVRHLRLDDAWQIEAVHTDRIDSSHTLLTSIDLRLPHCHAKDCTILYLD